MSAESAKISTELVEQVVSTVEAKRLHMPPEGKARLVRHMCGEIIAAGDEPPPDQDEILVAPALVEEVVFEVETWLELNGMEMHPIDKAELVRSICEEAAAGAGFVKGIVWRRLADHVTGESGG